MQKLKHSLFYIPNLFPCSGHLQDAFSDKKRKIFIKNYKLFGGKRFTKLETRAIIYYVMWNLLHSIFQIARATAGRIKKIKKAGNVMPQFVQTNQQKELINSLVQELPAYRKKMRMSQAELGDAVGKSRQKISEMERGAAPLGWDTYLAILMVLGAHGVLEPRGRDAERLAATGRLIGGRIRL